MTQTDLYKQEYVDAALKRYKYASVDDMYAAVGFGAISSSKVITRMLEEYRKDHNEENVEEKLEELFERKKENKVSNSGVIVKGIDNCLVKLSKCCNPLPGDDIIGYITKGRGVSVHRKDCINVKDLINEDDRIIDVEWANKNKNSYNVDIEIYANDRIGLIADIIKQIGNTKAKVVGINAKTNKEKAAHIDLTIVTESLKELNDIIKILRKVSGVYEVNRK